MFRLITALLLSLAVAASASAQSTATNGTIEGTVKDQQGALLPGTFRPDNLHPVAGGYDIWGAAVQAKLAELLK